MIQLPVSTDLDRAYAAGIIDGEGCICIFQSKDHRGGSLSTQVAMKDPAVPKWLSNTFGGTLRVNSTVYGPMYFWRLNAKSSGPFLELVLPFLKLKAPQAKLGLLFCELLGTAGRPNRMTDETLLMRLRIADMMNECNKRRVKITEEVLDTALEPVS